MYDNCPLIDSRRRPLKLSSIKYEHLYQLKNEQIEEGYIIEYKSEWNKDLTDKHLCKTITSFANSSGGWLFVGISNDGSIKGIVKQKCDYSQQIGNLLAAHTSPIPVFDCRFIKSSTDSEIGVLVIHVFEGFNPPYVSKGQICVRNGSSKTPVNANRADIDNLFAKTNRYSMRLNELLVNPTENEKIKSPFCVIALNSPIQSKNALQLKDTEKFITSMTEKTSFEACIRTADSIIFLNSNVVGPNNVTSYVEVFYDFSMRIVMYLPCYLKEKRDVVRDYILEHNKAFNISDFVLVDFCTQIMHINTMSEIAFAAVDNAKMNPALYSIQCEFKNVKDCILYFDPIDEFIDYIMKNGLNYSLKHVQRTFAEQIYNTKTKDYKGYFVALVFKNFAHAFGFSPKTLVELFSEYTIKHDEYFKTGVFSFGFNYNRQ